MATKIRGITIELNGDTSGLEKSLKGVNSKINSTQKELKDVEKLLKLDPTNTELLEQKQKLLADAVQLSKEKLDDLHEIEKNLKENGVDENSEQFRALQREIISAKANLDEAQKSADNFSVALTKAKQSADGVASASGKVAQKTKGLSAAAGGLLTSLVGMAYSSVTASDDLNTLAKQTGFTTAEIQKMQYAADLIDTPFEAISSGITSLTKKMASGSSAITDLGVRIADSNGNLRDANTVFYEVLRVLSDVENETERDALAMGIFGGAASDLAGVIDDGGKSLRDLGKEAEDLGIILDQDTLDSLNAVNDKIDTLKATAKGEFAEVGAKAMESLLPVFDSLIEKLSSVLEWVGNLDEQQINSIITILAVITAISPIAGIISGIAGAISGLITLFPAVKVAMTFLKTFAAENPLILIIIAVTTLAALIYEHWDKIKPILDEIWAKVKEVFDNVKEKVETIFEDIKTLFKTYINIFLGFFNKLIDGINKVIGGINSIKVDAPQWLTDLTGVTSFGFNIPKIASIPMLAKGGILSSGSAIVGEAGAELLSMRNGQAVVQPLTNNYTTNNYSSASNQPLSINVTMPDGTVLARAMYSPFQDVALLKGSKL